MKEKLYSNIYWNTHVQKPSVELFCENWHYHGETLSWRNTVFEWIILHWVISKTNVEGMNWEGRRLDIDTDALQLESAPERKSAKHSLTSDERAPVWEDLVGAIEEEGGTQQGRPHHLAPHHLGGNRRQISNYHCAVIVSPNLWVVWLLPWKLSSPWQQSPVGSPDQTWYCMNWK